jgi:hypothetical protein
VFLSGKFMFHVGSGRFIGLNGIIAEHICCGFRAGARILKRGTCHEKYFFRTHAAD